MTIPISIPCQANVTFVTIKSKLRATNDYEETVRTALSYLSLNLHESAKYFELDNQLAQHSLGFSLPPGASMNSPEASKRLVPTIRSILQKTRSQYLIILGGVTVIPMPFDNDSNYFDSKDGKIPSDDLYSMTCNNCLPSVIVSRFPTPPTTQSPTDIIEKTFYAFFFSNQVRLHETLEVGDACGSSNPPCLQ